MNRVLVRRRLWIAGAVVLLYAASVSSKWQIYPDSSMYLLMARSIAQGDGISIDGQPQGKYPPGYPFFLAILIKMGLTDMLWLNLIMTAMGLAALFCTYRLLCYHTSPRWALLLTLALGTTYEIYSRSTAQLSDVPFTLLVTAGLWCLTHGLAHRQPTLEGGCVLLVASCWIRVIGIPLALASSVGLLLQPRAVAGPRLWFNTAALVCGALLTGLWLYQRDRAVQSHPFPPASYENTLSKITEGTLTNRLVQPFINLYHSGRTLSELFTGQRLPKIAALVLFWIPVAAGAIYSLRHRQFLLLFAGLGYLGAILLIEVPITRYYLPVAPVLFLWFGFGVRAGSTWLSKVRLSQGRVPLLIVVVLLLMVCNLPKNLRHIYRQQTPSRYKSDEEHDLVQIASFLRNEKQRSDDVTFVMETDAPSVAFLSGTSFLNIPKSLTQHAPPAAAIYKTLLDENVGYLVLWKNSDDRRVFFDVLRSAVPTWPEFKLVYSQDNFQIFGHVLPSQQANETKQQDVRPVASSKGA